MKIPKIPTAIIRFLKFFFWTLAVIIVGFVIFLVIYGLSAKTTPEGMFNHAGLSAPVQISYDHSDIPHIEARSNNDAWFAMGYLHARERSWQLEFNRRLASGSLSEILGEQTVGVDRFIRTLGIRKAAHEQYEHLPNSTKLSLQAYANGVNAGFSDLGWALPLEFFLMRTKPGYWNPVDSISWSLMMALDLGDNWNREFTRLEYSAIMPTQRIWELMPPYAGEAPATSVDFAKMYQNMGLFDKPAAGSAKLPEQKSSQVLTLDAKKQLASWLPGGLEGIGSNNWVVDGKHSSTGKPWLANDPHLGLTAPAVWYFAHIKTNNMNVMGATLPGLPPVILGRTDKFAWGFTNTSPDVQDLYIEAIDAKNPGAYKTPEGSAPFTIRKEVINVKGKSPVEFLVRSTRHGPVISDAYPRALELIDGNRFALALRWTALDDKNQSVQAMFDMNKAKNLDEFKVAIHENYAPMQNIVMADTDGNIAFEAAGTAPRRIRNAGLFGVVPAPGWDKQYDWTGYLKYEELPHQENPASGFIATANQRVQDEHAPYPLTADWSPPYRYDRIVELLNSKNQHDLKSMMAMQADTVSNGSIPLIPFLNSVQSQHPLAIQAKAILANFKGDMRVDSAAALIFNAWADQLTRRVFEPHLGDLFQAEYSKRGFRPAIINVVNNHIEYWCDNPKTEKVETCQDLNQEAFDAALTYLSHRFGSNPDQWKWGDAHIAISEHRPLSRSGLVGRIFEIYRKVPGDGYTINVGRTGFENPNEPFASYTAPSLRAIYDFSDLDKSQFIYQAGQSGWVLSRRYRQYADDWAANRYLPLSMNPSEKPLRAMTLAP